MTTLTQVQQADIERLATLYTLAEPDAITAFLHQYPYLVPILLEAYPQIRLFFPEPELALRMYHDPTGVDDPELLVEIAAVGDMSDATIRDRVDRLAQFDYAWWLDNMARTRYRLTIR